MYHNSVVRAKRVQIMKSKLTSEQGLFDTNSNLNLIHGLEQIRRTRRIVA